MGLVELLIIILVVVVVLAILHRFVVPLLPHPYGQLVLAIAALIAVVYLLMRSGLISG